jgi:hypothetical protein
MDTHRWKLYSRFWIGNTAGMVQENATFKEIILSSGSGYWIDQMATNSQHLF